MIDRPSGAKGVGLHGIPAGTGREGQVGGDPGRSRRVHTEKRRFTWCQHASTDEWIEKGSM